MHLLLLGLAALVVVPAVLMVAAAFFMRRPARAVIGPPPADLAVERVSFRSGNGALIQGWYVPGQPGAGAVALFHGVRGNRIPAVDRMRFLSQAGYGVLVIDFQAHGESEGEAITFGKLESLDAEAALGWLRQRTEGPIAAIGASLGGAALLVGAKPPPVDAIVLEAVYPTIDEAVANRFGARYGPPGRWIAPIFVWIGQWVTGIRRFELRPIDGIGRLTMPVLIMGGTLDHSTRIEETRAMFAAVRADRRELWEVEGAGHLDLHGFAPADYEHRVLAFLAGMRPGQS